jgi:hypothetical protein
MGQDQSWEEVTPAKNPETRCGSGDGERQRDLPDFRVFFVSFTDALGFFSPSSGFRGTLFSIRNSFLHFGQLRLPNVIVSITVTTTRGALQCGHLMGISVSGNLKFRLDTEF